jgi:amidase
MTLGAPASILSENGVFPTSSIDATVVSRLLGAGAVIKGTSTCECFCASPLSFTSATGPVHNPRLHGYTAGGSSSGSCALVAAQVLESQGNGRFGQTVELAIGSDQAGSVRIPASYNGLYGLKPTFGLIPYTGAASMSPMIDHLGPIASRLEDIARLL